MARNGALTETDIAEITAVVKARKGSVHAPKQVLTVDAIPLTALRARFA